MLSKVLWFIIFSVIYGIVGNLVSGVLLSINYESKGCIEDFDNDIMYYAYGIHDECGKYITDIKMLNIMMWLFLIFMNPYMMYGMLKKD